MLVQFRRWWQQHPYTMPALLLAFWLSFTLGWRPLANPDEGRYATVALDMAYSHHWMVPLMNGLPFFHKPPLFYWITAAAQELFGATVWASRTASALGAWLMGMATYLFTRHYHGQQRATWTLLILATLPLYFAAAQYINLDMLIASMISLTILSGAHAAMRMVQGQPHGGWLWLAYAFAALGLLAKGLIGIVLPAGVLVLWLAWLRQWHVVLRMLSVPGLVLFAALGAPWFYFMEQQFPEFYHYFFVYQHFQRFTQGAAHNVQKFNNQHGAWFYFTILVLACLPWTIWLASAAKRWWQQRPTWRQVLAKPHSTEAMVRSLWIVWLIVIVGFFSLPKSKLVGYILPTLPAWAALLQLALQHQSRVRMQRTLQAAASLCVLAVAGFTWTTARDSAQTVAESLRHHMQNGDQIVMLDNYRYDLAFYLNKPLDYAWVVSDWHDPDIANTDNWRKALAEAGAFDPAAQTHLLMMPQDLVPHMCEVLQQGRNVWIWADPSSPQRYTFLQKLTADRAEGALHHRLASVWHVAPTQADSVLGCQQATAIAPSLSKPV